ncbi:hypothetical protein AAHC03_01935 [Spirometra sp. Aus1]
MDEKMAAIREAIANEKLRKGDLYVLDLNFLLEKDSLMQELERRKLHLLNAFNAASDKRLRENEYNSLIRNIDLSLQFQRLGARVNGLMARQDSLQVEQQELTRNVGLTEEMNAVFEKKTRDTVKAAKEKTALCLSMEKEVQELREKILIAEAEAEAEKSAYDKLCKKLDRKSLSVARLKSALAEDWQKNDDDALRLSSDEYCLAQMTEFVQHLHKELRRTKEVFEVVEEGSIASHPARFLSKSELVAQRSGLISLLLTVLQTACKLGMETSLPRGFQVDF